MHVSPVRPVNTVHSQHLACKCTDEGGGDIIKIKQVFFKVCHALTTFTIPTNYASAIQKCHCCHKKTLGMRENMLKENTGGVCCLEDLLADLCGSAGFDSTRYSGIVAKAPSC